VPGIGPGIAGQARLQVGRCAQHVHHGAAGQGVEQDGDRRGRGQLAAADAAPDDGPRGQHLRAAHGRVVLGHPGDGGRLHVQAQHDGHPDLTEHAEGSREDPGPASALTGAEGLRDSAHHIEQTSQRSTDD